MNRYLLPLLLLSVPIRSAAMQISAGRVEGTVHFSTRPAAGAVVFLEPGVPHSFDYPEQSAIVDQVNLRFVPQVLAVLPGTMVAFPNSDPILHNVFSPGLTGRGFNLGTYPPGEERAYRFDDPGIHVILCHVHPEMVAYVAVVPTPYRAVIDTSGAFEIEGVPPGRYTLRIWRVRRPAVEREVIVTEGGVTVVRVQMQP